MSTTIDQKVVEMRFDNRQFEQNVQTSMSTLDKLKQKLNLTGAAKGLENINSSANKVNMSGLSGAIDTVHAKFSAMEVIGVTALANITNSAMNAGKRIVSALTIDPVKTGFQEYETQINAVQTILANTQKEGATIDQVNAALKELNDYADLTIYNFTEMTRNIGTFTAAGIDLKTSVSAIQGIANLAAVSGSTSQQASTAMYQLSQALASGTVKLMDWNSVVNAGMGGQVFQDALKKTSELLGTGAEAAIKAKGSFRESLTTGWLTAEVLTETLKKFTTSGANEYVAEYTGLSKEAVEVALESAEAQYGEADAIDKASEALAQKSGKNKEEIKQALQFAKTAEDAATKVKTFTQLWDVLKEAAQSGWAQTWQLIIGDFEDAKALFTPLSEFLTDIITKISDARNDVLRIAMDSPFAKIVEKIKEVTKATEKVVEATKDYGDIVNRVIRGEFGHGQSRWDKLTEAGYDWAKVQNLVNEKLGNSVRHTERLSEEQSNLNETQDTTIEQLAEMSDAKLKEIGFTEEEIKSLKELKEHADRAGYSLSQVIENPNLLSGRSLMIDSFENIGKSLITIFTSIKQAWVDIFNPSSTEEKAEKLYNALGSIRSFTADVLEKINANSDKLTRTFKGLFAVIDIITTFVGGGFKLAFKVVSKILGAFNLNILDVTASIGDALVVFRDWLFENNALVKGFNKLVEKIPGAIEVVKEWFGSFKEIPAVKKVIESFEKVFELLKKLTKLRSASSSMSKFLKEQIVGQIKDNLIAGLKAIPDAMVEFGKDIVSGLENGIGVGISEIPSKIIEFASKIITTFCEMLGIHSPSTVFFEFGKNIVEGLVNGIAAGIGLLVDGLKMLGGKIADIFNGIHLDKAVGSFSDAFSKFKELLGKIDFTKLLAIIPVTVVLLVVKRILDITKAFADGINGINEVIEGFANLEKKLGKVLNSFALSLKANALKKIAISLAILVGAVIALTFVDPDKLYSAVTVIGVLAGILIGLAFATDKMSSASVKFDKGVNVEGLKSGLISIGLSLLLLAATVKLIGSMNPEEAKQGFLGLAALVVAVGVVFTAYGTLVKGKAAQNIDKAGVMIRKLATSLLLMVLVVKLVGMLDWEEMGKGAAFVAGFTVFVWGLVAVTKTAGKNIDKIGKMLTKVSFAMLLMIGVCKLAGQLSVEEALTGAAFATAFTLFVRALVKITKTEKDTQIAKLGGLLMSISFSLMLMVGVCKLVGMLSVEELVKGAAFITGFMILVKMLTKITTISNEQKTAKVAGTILAFSVAIGVLAGLSILLGLVDNTALAKGVGAVTILGLMMTAMIRATRGANNVKGNLIVMTIAIGVMVGAVALLSTMDPKKLAGATAALSILMGMFALIAKSAGTMGKVMGPLIVMTIAVGMLGGLLYLLSGLPTKSLLGVAASLSILLLALSASLKILSTVLYVSKSALTAMSVMTLVVAGLAIILGVLSKFNATPSIETATSLSILLIAMAGVTAILSLIGPAAAGALAGVAALAIVIAGVGGIMVALGWLMDKFPSMEKFLDEGIPILEKIGHGLGSFLGNIISGFAEGLTDGLPEMAKNIKEFVNSFAGIDSGAVDGAGSLVKVMGIMAGVNIADFVSTILTGGKNPMETFKSNILMFADAMIAFSEKIGDGIDGEAVSSAVNAGSMMAALQDAIPTDKWFDGKVSIDDFGKKIKKFGEYLVDYSDEVDDVNSDAISKSINYAKDLVEIAKSVVGIDADKVSNFSKVKTIGKAMKEYSDKVEDIDTETFSSSVSSASKLRTLVAGLAGLDTSGISNFTVDSLGGKIKGYSDKVKDITTSSLSASISAIDRLIVVIKKMTGLDSNGVETFKTAVKSLSEVQIDGIVKAFNGASGKLSKIGVDLISGIAKGMQSKQGVLKSTSIAIVSGIVSSFTTKLGIFLPIGAKIVTSIANGITSHRSVIPVSIMPSLAVAIGSISGYYSMFYYAGSYLVSGFANGISANSYKAAAKAKAMAGEALQAAKAALKEHSPSKAFYQVGDYAGKGFVNALDDYGSKSYAAGSEMADYARRGLSNAISRVTDLLNGSIDTQPTIRPVLDLSDVQSGVDSMSGMFNMQPSVGVMSNLGAINSMMSQNRQNGINESIVSELGKLRKDLQNVGGNTYNVNGITYDDGSNVSDAIGALIRAAKIERRT